jgi:transcriptional regulator with XRE-family HTH domain
MISKRSAFVETISDRLRIIRKHFELTTRAFGKSIKLTGAAITNMEKGRRNITERTIDDICREYRISQQWFLNGIGPMFVNILDGIKMSYEVRQITEKYAQLSEHDKILVHNLVDSLMEKNKVNSDKRNANAPPQAETGA